MGHQLPQIGHARSHYQGRAIRQAFNLRSRRPLGWGGPNWAGLAFVGEEDA
jgi:hypothetical protein